MWTTKRHLAAAVVATFSLVSACGGSQSTANPPGPEPLPANPPEPGVEHGHTNPPAAEVEEEVHANPPGPDADEASDDAFDED